MVEPGRARTLRSFIEVCEERPRDREAWIQRIATAFARAMGSERGSVFAIGSRSEPLGYRLLASTAEPRLRELLNHPPADFPSFVKRAWPRAARIASWRRFGLFDPDRASQILSALVPGAYELRGLFVDIGQLTATIWVPLYEGHADRTPADRTLLRFHRHLSGALLRERDLADADLVVTENGRVVQASAAGERAVLDRARDVALAFARSAGPRVESDDDAEKLWEELWRGGWSVSQSVDEGGARIVVLRRVTSADPAPTARERAALRLAADGRALKRIASELGTSEATASTHLQRGLRKLGVDDRAALVRLLGAAAPDPR